jgi:hypothetical protein
MKALPVASDVAAGIQQKLGDLATVSNLSVTAKNGVITVTAKVGPAELPALRGVIDGYKDSGFPVVLDRRIGA